MTTETRAFRPARWLPGAHGQTMWPQLARSRRLVDVEREALPTPDGDELLLDRLRGEAAPGAPRLMIFHGLEGSSFSSYAQGMLEGARRKGWAATAMNFRSCARRLDDRRSWIPNKRPRLYHSGETGDLELAIERAAEAEPERPLLAFGVSLGGNALLKWLGDHPDQRLVTAAATLSVPYDLSAASGYLKRPAGRLYFRHFHKTLSAKLDHLVALFPEAPVDLEATRRARDFVAYDQAATAPLHGFAGAADYYERCSSLAVLDQIGAPTLCVSARDDPFLPPEVLDEARRRASSSVELVVTEGGGHVGFLSGASPLSPRYWAEELALRWLEAHVEER